MNKPNRRKKRQRVQKKIGPDGKLRARVSRVETFFWYYVFGDVIKVTYGNNSYLCVDVWKRVKRMKWGSSSDHYLTRWRIYNLTRRVPLAGFFNYFSEIGAPNPSGISRCKVDPHRFGDCKIKVVDSPPSFSQKVWKKKRWWWQVVG